eukprot:2204776-Pyramimonas_sp.AAC.1
MFQYIVRTYQATAVVVVTWGPGAQFGDAKFSVVKAGCESQEEDLNSKYTMLTGWGQELSEETPSGIRTAESRFSRAPRDNE